MSACKSARAVIDSLSRSLRENLDICVWAKHVQAFQTYPQEIVILRAEPSRRTAKAGETYLLLSRDDASGFERGRIPLPQAKRLAKDWFEG